MAQPKFKADMITPRANETFIRATAIADSPHASPARMLQDSLETAFNGDTARWSARRSAAFIVSFNLVAWAMIGTGIMRLLG